MHTAAGEKYACCYLFSGSRYIPLFRSLFLPHFHRVVRMSYAVCCMPPLPPRPYPAPPSSPPKAGGVDDKKEANQQVYLDDGPGRYYLSGTSSPPEIQSASTLTFVMRYVVVCGMFSNFGHKS